MKKEIKPIDFIPEGSKLKFIRQTVVGWRRRSTNEQVRNRALYQCVCGKEKEIDVTDVKRGRNLSCGCLGKENQRASVTKHGIWNSPLYNVWMDIKNRCYKPRHRNYKNYGGRGVRMCEEWKNDVLSFERWCLRNGWKRRLHVDKDIKGNGLLYSPETCSIVTAKQNSNKTRKNVFIEYNGKTKTMSEWSEEFRINYGTLFSRLKKGWDLEKAFTNKSFK